ncbi:WD40/YVTN/BNR-like repeat-containing protein [Sulfobacillus thermosulfidooxidans]|uniref:WD40/YVTN/BNR-like repeat-containing protein n=1 Tax=Sulfobacillus thermosulfidooxidans TaxID=28034 RepID=UPI00096BB57B|nr:hypothetical protein [Sulfobacillus thermosulfidooxidans]OLZ11368.1 hypothetical protein BFX05_07765 [Sulfobacillus thermosulfidooxidans]OLZ14034.1 hypothetical protein BFX06_06915 [Sulfobacillus thermosulfidooxidans]OLZ19874.1 hypothetical protein BFX07_01945 [Sulfobacillus thermosulfidooxidans]
MKNGQTLILFGISFIMLAACGTKPSMSQSLSLSLKPFRVNQETASIRPVLASATLSLSSVQFFTARYGDATGVIGQYDGVFQTTNGGYSWKRLYTRPVITHLHMLNSQDGWLTTCSHTGCSDANQLMKTVNGGKTWQLIYQAGPDISLGVPDFVSTTTGYMVETNQQTMRSDLMRTNNGGQSWVALNSPLHTPGVVTNAVDFLTPHTGWLLVGQQMGAGAETKALYHTHNGGQSWQLIASTGSLSTPSPHPPIPLGGYVDSEGTGLLFLNDASGYLPLVRGPILMTRDAGRQFTPVWTSIFTPSQQTVLSLSFPSPTTWFVLSSFQGMNTLWRTRNRGKTWSVIYPPLTPNGPIAWTSHQIGVGISTQGYQSDLLITHNGGMSWAVQHKFSTLAGTPYWGPDHSLWMTTAQGSLSYSLNHGYTFSRVKVLPHDHIQTLATNAHTILAAVKTSHGLVPMRLEYPMRPGSKIHWQILNWPVSPQWIAEPRAHDIWALGTNRAQSQAFARFHQSHPNPKAIARYTIQHPLALSLYHRNKNGQWVLYDLPPNISALNPPQGLFFLSTQMGYFWTAAQIFVTDNGGKSWTQILSPQDQPISFVDFISSSEAWISFENGFHAWFVISLKHHSH